MDFLSMMKGVEAGAGSLAALGSMLGIGQNRQIRQQKELQEHAAQLNYEYGEKSAENAFERQMKAYEQSYSDNTLQNQVNQARNAGLSIGMLYGGGAQGGGEGSLSGGTQGTGAAGVAPGQAPNAGMEMQGLALLQQGARSAAEVDLMKSQAEYNRAKAKESESVGKKANEDAETARQIRQYMVEGQRQEAIALFIKNCQEEWKSSDLYGDDNNEAMSYNNAELMFNFTIAQSSYNVEMMTATLDNLISDTNRLDELIKLAKEQAETEDEKQLLIAAQKAFVDEQTRYYWKVVQAEYMQALAAVQNAETRIKELNVEIVKQKADTIFRTAAQKNANLKTALDAIQISIQKQLTREQMENQTFLNAVNNATNLVGSLISAFGSAAMLSMLL